MPSTDHAPRPEEFGVSDAALVRVRPPFVASHRGPLCFAVIGVLLITAIVAMTLYSGSLAAGLILAPLFVAAALVVVLPLTFAMVCLAGRLEERWWSDRDPEFDACRRYRQARASYRTEELREQQARARVCRQDWCRADRSRLLAAASVLLEAETSKRLDRRETGADLLVRRGGTLALVRAEPGPEPVDVAVARELAMARLDLGADEVVLVAPGGGTPTLERYIPERAIRLLGPSELVGIEPP